MKIPSTASLIVMFSKINSDIAERNSKLANPEEGESIVELTDIEYYAEQIQNIYECSTETAEVAANLMAANIKTK